MTIRTHPSVRRKARDKDALAWTLSEFIACIVVLAIVIVGLLAGR